MIDQIKAKFLETGTLEQWYSFVEENKTDLVSFLLGGEPDILKGLLEDQTEIPEVDDVVGEFTPTLITSIFQGRQYLKKNRWYGYNSSTGPSYPYWNRNFSSKSMTQEPVFTNQAIGFNIKGTVKKIHFDGYFSRSSNIVIKIIRQTKTPGSNSVVNEVLYTSNQISVTQNHYTEIKIEQGFIINENQLLLPLWNTDNNSTSYFYNTTKFIWHG